MAQINAGTQVMHGRYNELIGDPVSFPAPVVMNGRKMNLSVITNPNNPPVDRVVLHTQTNKFYEFGRLLKEAIYGQVQHGIMLTLNDGKLARVLNDTLQPATPVAIKVYKKANIRALRRRSQENPVQELSVMQYIGQHPNVMTPIEVCQDPEYLYLIMNFCDGGELYDKIEESQRLPEETSRNYFRQILTGLQHLQNLGIAHRDMSLENVMISDNTCKIIDFGMGIRVPQNPATGEFMKISPQGVCGKKNYVSPEVLENNRPHNPLLGDIWAVGVMLFIMLTGRPPVEMASTMDGRYQMICQGGLHAMLDTWAIPMAPDAIDLIQRILRPVPEERLTIQQIFAHPWTNRE